MERNLIEELSASLVREYLSRKRLAKTLKLLDEEQAEYSSCVRSRLKLLKALHIGRLVKRNKARGYPLDSMVEVIVHFLVEHARASKQNDLKEGGSDIVLCKTTPFPQPSRGNDADPHGTKDIVVPKHLESVELVLHGKDDAPLEKIFSDNSNSISSNACTVRESNVGALDETDQGSDLTDFTNKLDTSERHSRGAAGEPPVIVERENNHRLSDVAAVMQGGESMPRPSAPSTTSSCCSSDTESSDSEYSSESDSEPSMSSIIDLTKESYLQRDPKAAEMDLSFKIPKFDHILMASDDSEDDLELIDVGTEDVKEEFHLPAGRSSNLEGEMDELEEVVSARPSRLGVDTLSRPGTQESGGSGVLSPRHLLWLHKNGEVHEGAPHTEGVGGGGPNSPPVMKINAHIPNFNSFDGSLETFRPQVNGGEMRNGLQNPIKAPSNGYIPNGMSGSLMNGHMQGNGSILNGSVSSAIQGKKNASVFDTDADVDIATMAAQRDQLRGARNVRGMMAPVMSTEEDSHTKSATRRLQVTRQRSESILGVHGILEGEETNIFSSQSQRDGDDSDVLGNLTRRRRNILDGLHGVGLRPSVDYLDADRQGDIMAQSMRRQSLRGSKQNLKDGSLGNFNPMASSRLSLGNGSPEEYAVLKSESDGGSLDRKGRNLPKFIPNAHEDIQILNLQGFMDASAYLGNRGSTSKRKNKKKRGKRVNEEGVVDQAREAYKFSSKPRRKRNHRNSKSFHSEDDDDGEMVLKDIDDLDDKVAGLVLGPKNTNNDSVGRPITLEEASDIKTLLLGSPAQSLPNEWMIQNFKQNTNSNLSYGLVQKKGGPCGVLACVQAYIMKSLIFGSVISPNTSPISPLRPSNREWSWALSTAITEILWKAGQEQKAILALPGSFPHFDEQGIGRYSRDGLTETLTLHEYVEQYQLHNAVTNHLAAFTNESSAGCVVLLFSALLSRGIENVKTEMDAGGGHLINVHGYSSQEIVNLLLTGHATTNTFNGEQSLGTDPSQMIVLHGIQHKSEIGFLSLFEHYDCYKVGSYLKSPQYPIWVICCESHFSVIFSRDTLVTSDMPSITKFDLYYYDGLALQDDEIRLTIDLDRVGSDVAVVPPLELCIRTKWHTAVVEWNGMDPLL